MRGCLSVIVVGVSLLAAIVWFGGPPVASAIVTATLNAGGLAADQLEVEVIADPPLKLAAGRADRVTIHATGARWNGVQLARLELTLGSVDLVGRTATTVEGRLDGVQLDAAGGQSVLADVELNGSAEAAETTIHVDTAVVETVALAAFEARLGVRPSAATLVAPDGIRVVVGPMTVSGKLSVGADGSVVVVADGTKIDLFTANLSALRPTSLAVRSSGLELHGTFDADRLLH